MNRPALLYDNRLGDALPVASSTAPGEYDVVNLINWRDYNFWKPAVIPATVTTDAGAAKAADYAVVWGHDLGSNGATFEVHASTDNFVASDDTLASVTPTDDEPFAVYFTSASYRYWRFALTGASGLPAIAIVSIGAALQMPSNLEAGFDPVKRDPRGQFNRSVNGRALGRAIFFEGWADTLKFTNVSWDFERNVFRQAWADHLRGTPFVLSWDRIDHPTELHLVSATGGYNAPHQKGALAPLTFPVSGLAL